MGHCASRLAVAVALTTALGAGCTADRPGGNKADAGMGSGSSLLPPSFDTSVPVTTPNDTVAVRGTTSGSRVVISGGPGDPVVQSVLPSGGFCLDTPLLASGPTALTAYALRDGLISAASVITVTKDPAAPIPQDALCLGQEMPVCVPEDAAHSDCTNGKDDDCNGFTDACDPSCNGCVDDGLGPNWVPFFVPMIGVGTYHLEICPCRPDYFGFAAMPGDSIHAKATFAGASIDLDMILQTSADAEANLTTSVASSVTTSSVEEINFSVTTASIYYLKVYPYDAAKFGPYTLTIF